MNVENLIVFGLAFAGYLLLCLSVVAGAFGRSNCVFALVTAIVVGVHVFLVWHLRFEWSFAFAWSKGPPAFLIFHTALLLILAAPFSRHRDILMLIAFAIVSIGAIGATFRYDYVALYRWPLVLACAATLAMSGYRRLIKR